MIFSVNKVGGVLKDITPDMLKHILTELDQVEADVRVIEHTFLFDYSVQSRLKGVGVLSRKQVHMLGAVGPFARASGINIDMRSLGYEAYGDLDFEPIVSSDGDSYARCEVRIHEIYQSIDIIRQAISNSARRTHPCR